MSSYGEGKHDPCIKVAAYTQKEELIEEERTLSYPVIASPDQYCDSLLHATSMTTATHASLHWGSTWNMNTPLQNLEPGSFVLIKICFSNGNNSATSLTTVYWTRYSIDSLKIDSTYDEILPLNDCLSTHGGGGCTTKQMLIDPVNPPVIMPVELLQVASILPVSYCMVDCLLHQYERPITNDDVKK